MQLEFQADLTEVKKLIEKLSPRGRYLMNLDIGKELWELTRDRFQTGTDPYGQRWQALAPSTLDSMVNVGRGQTRRMYGTTPLRRMGDLMNSFSRRESSADAAIVSTDKTYLKYHQSPEPRRRLPRRMVFPDADQGLPETYRQRVKDLISEQLELYK
jgi:phage virion morphogenesis protein